jgi:hypothetical protein
LYKIASNRILNTYVQLISYWKDMVQIQTKIFSTKNESVIRNVLGDISNEYIFDGNPVFRSIKAPTCNSCGAQMVHNGFNR